MISKNLYLTGPFSKNNFPLVIKNNIEKIKNNNENYNIIYYDDKDCEIFLENNFNKIVIESYKKIIPTAFKADFFRYCILYMNGGIYSDLLQGFNCKLDNIVNHEYDLILVQDEAFQGIKGIQISFLASKAKSDILEFVIRYLVNKIVNKNPGVNPLDFSGPLFFRECLLRFFNIRNIPIGNYKLLGINGKYYKISNVLKQYNGSIYFNGKEVISRKIVNNKILYNSSFKNYKIMWPLIF